MIGALGRWTIAQSREFFAAYLLPYAALKGAWLERGRGARLLARSVAVQIFHTAVEPLVMFLTIGVTLGAFVTAAADGLMRPNGLAPHVPVVVAQATVGELIPIVIAVLLVGRSGTAITTELGYMRVNREVEALEAIGVNVDYFLVLPRLVGMIVAAVGLTILTGAAALVGGFLTAKALNQVSAGLRLGQVLGALTPGTLVLALLKAVIFGLTIGAISSFYGLSVGRHFAEIPRANAQGSTRGFFGCFLLNAVISVYALSGWR
jgi:phospholipid/cholesterol/gamma-HCH transport system permease protein